MKNLAKFGMMPGLIQCKYKLMITVPLLDHYALLLFDPWPDCNPIYKSITLIYEPIELPGKMNEFSFDPSDMSMTPWRIIMLWYHLQKSCDMTHVTHKLWPIHYDLQIYIRRECQYALIRSKITPKLYFKMSSNC